MMPGLTSLAGRRRLAMRERQRRAALAFDGGVWTWRTRYVAGAVVVGEDDGR